MAAPLELDEQWLTKLRDFWSRRVHPDDLPRVLEGLRGEGESPTFVLFALASALFVLRGMAEGKSAERLFGEQRLFNKPLQRAVQAASRRYTPATLDAALAQAATIDRVAKGVARGDPWDQLAALGLKLAGGSKA